MRSLWKGTISFGLVTIPVKLYAATEEQDVRFHYLHRECKTPIRYQKVCPACQREVTMAEIVRGYEYEPGRFVVVEAAEFERLPTTLARTVEIVEFVDLADIDPIYYLRTYFLEPGEGGAKAYSLLRRALLETGRIGIARVALRGKGSLAAIRLYRQECLVMETMHFPEEIRNPAGLHLPPDAGYRPQELEMAKMLIGALANRFVPEEYRNEYREALLALLREKIAGQEIYQPEVAAPAAPVLDLMEALRRSISLAEAARQGALAPDGAAGR